MVDCSEHDARARSSRLASTLCGETIYNDLKPTPLGANEHFRAETDSVWPHAMGYLRVSSIGTRSCSRISLVGKDGPRFGASLLGDQRRRAARRKAESGRG